nr:PIN domain-containing protein [uncultured Draconibacterium sp.]
MNIFLDTNILYEDYFFDNKSPKKILEYARNGIINLYMSEIVRLELKWQFQKEIEAKNRELSKVIKDSKRLKIDTDITLLDLDSQLEKFDRFYSRLENIDNFKIVQYKNEYLPDIVDRAIYRKKPFTEEKTELKDALIWKSYSDFVESNQLEDCILLTNNTSDFCPKKDKSKIHPDLLADTEKFSVINSAFAFLKSKSTILESPIVQFQAYMTQLDFNDDLIKELIIENFDKVIEKEVHEKIENLSPNDILKSDYWYDGYVSGSDVEILDCEDVEYEILADNALVSGKVFVACETECYQYNAARDHGEETFSYLNDQTIIFEIYFNFDMKENEECSEFEITDLDINEVT